MVLWGRLLSYKFKLLFAVVGAGGLAAAGTLCWSKMETLANESYLFTAEPLEAFKTEFETRKISKDSKNVFDLKGGDCLKRFLQGVTLSKPSVVGDKVTLDALPNMDFSKETMGCKLKKFSKTHDDKGFVYKSETIIKNDRYGLILSMGVTNLKVARKVDYEMWINFLERSGNGWSTIKSLGWEGVFEPTGDTPKFKTKYPFAWSYHYWQVNHNPVLEDIEAFHREYGDVSKWKEDETATGFWLPTDSACRQEDLFEEGSTEKWALKLKFDKDTDEQPKIFGKLKIGQTGDWIRVRDYCIDYKNIEPMNVEKKYRDMCYTSIG